MAAEDRRLSLAGYELYRFGGAEFVDRVHASKMLREFYVGLLELSA